MILNQISVFLENRTGRLDEVLETLKVNNINILSLFLYKCNRYLNFLAILLSKTEKAFWLFL